MSFLAPFGLLLGGLAAPLIAMYFLKLRRRRVVVPSTLLWQAVERSERAARPFDRFRRNLLLLLQLLLLLLVTLALARPYLETEAAPYRSVVLVVDVSASMGAVDVPPTRLGAAVDAAGDVLGDLGPGDEVMLVVAGPRTEVLVPFTRDGALVSAKLGELAPTQAEGSLREGLQLALSMARSRGDVDVVVFSDGSGEDLSDLPTGGTPVRYVPVGVSGDNTGIVALDLRRSSASDLDRQLFVTVQTFGATPAPSTVEVYLEGKLVGLRNEVVAPDSPVSLVFDLPAGASGTLRVALEAEGDKLPADDEAFTVLSEVVARRVLMIGGDGFTARALAVDPRLVLTQVGAKDFRPELLATADAIVVGADVPPGLDGRNLLILGPYAGGPLRFGPTFKTPTVLGWRRTHPALRFVEWADVGVARGHSVIDPGGLVPVVESDEGPLVWAGELGGARVVQLAFQPLESDLPLRVAWPVFLLNSVGWLSESASGGDGSVLVPTGSPYVRRLPDGADPASVRVTGPGGASVEAVVDDGLLRVRDTSRAGVYEVRADGLNAKFSAVLLSPRESRIAVQGTLGLADVVAEASQASVVGRREIWRPLALLGLIVLLLEWFAWNRRKAA